jgi:RND superfamily putative drug exporter
VTHDPRHGLLLRRWGRFVTRHPRSIVASWLAFIVAGFVLALGVAGTPALFDRLHSGEIVVPGENADGRDLLARGGSTGFSTYILTVEGVDLADPAVVRAAATAARDIGAIPRVASAVNPFVVPGGPSGPLAAPMLGDGGLASGDFAMVVTYDESNTKEQEAAAQGQVDAVLDRLVAQVHPESSQRGGIRSLVDAIIGQVKKDGQRGEGIALPISFVVMVVVFGGFLAAGLPILGAIASIAGALASLLGFSYLLELDASVVNVVTVLGLGLCIDYGLLVVSRFREELRLGIAGAADPTARRGDEWQSHVSTAAATTIDRAGRTVVFSALTVAISLCGLFVFDVQFIRAVAAAGVSVVLVALAVAVSLIPALCVLGARRILGRGTETSGDTGVFSRLAVWIQRRPWPVIVGVLALLLLAAAPALGIRLTSSGAELLPKGTPERTFFESQQAVFPHLVGAEVAVVSTAPRVTVQAWAAEAARLPGVRSVDPVTQLEQGVVVLGLRTGDGGLGNASRELVDHLREERPPFDADVVGQASSVWDFRAAIVERGPWALLLVALVTFVLLFLMTGSFVIPVKALAMNIISLGACLGAVVWVFQDGHLDGLLDFTSTGAIETTLPLLVLAFGFGLSMDYEVFLLSRIVELHEQGHETDTAVRLGLQRSGRIITSAALLMVIVFAGFVAADLLIMKQMGFGLVVAVLVDATLVRMLLVPATMTVLGRTNWWAPTSMRRLHERFGITE